MIQTFAGARGEEAGTQLRPKITRLGIQPPSVNRDIVFVLKANYMFSSLDQRALGAASILPGRV